MTTLPELAYASEKPRRSLPSWVPTNVGRHWQVSTMVLKDLAKLHAEKVPDVLWIDLDHVSPGNAHRNLLKHVNLVVGKTSPAPFVFITGNAEEDDTRYDAIVREVYACFPRHLDRVNVDLTGRPDIRSTLIKWWALHNEADAAMVHKTAMPEGAERTRPMSVPDQLVRDPDSGRVSAKKVAPLFGVPLTTLADWIHCKRSTVAKTADAPALQDALTPYAHVARLVPAFPNEGAFRQWLNAPHELLEGKSPLHWLAAGKAQEIAEFATNALTGQPT